MIDYYAAYSPYAMLLIAMTIMCTAAGAFLCAYGVIKAERNFLLWATAAALLGFVCVPVLGFMALVSPSLELRNLYLLLRNVAALLIFAPLLLIFFGICLRGLGFKLCAMSGLVFMMHGICTFYLWENTFSVKADYFPIFDFWIFCLFLALSARSLFVELSPVSIDNFMQEIDDMILIFEKNGKLIDANKQAEKTWLFLNKDLTVGEFFKNLEASIILKKASEKTGAASYEEIALSFSGEERHFLCRKTPVKNKKGNIIATVLNFYDITEKSMLEKKLAEKNAELEEMNSRLKNFLDTAEELMEEEQKAEALNEIKEAVGIKIEKLLSDLERMCSRNTHEKLSDLIERCREVMADVRLAMQKLMPEGRKDVKDD